MLGWPGLGILALAADTRVAEVKLTGDILSVVQKEGRMTTLPLAEYPRLLDATAAQRKNRRIAGSGYGIHWLDVNEVLSTEGLSRGAPAPRPATIKASSISRRPKKG